MAGIKIDLPLEGTGGGSIDTLTDVDLSNLQDGYTLVWNELSQLWESGANTGGYTDTMAQDSLAGVITDTSTIDLKYNNILRTFTADVISDGVTIQTGSKGIEVKSGVFAPTIHTHCEYLKTCDFNTIIDGYLTEADLPACLIVESELTTCLTGYSTTSHNHTGVYSPVGHGHAGVYEPANSNIQCHIACADIHCPSSTFSLANHNHSGVYQPVGSYALACDLNSYSLTSHTHAGVYQPVGDYVITCNLTSCLTGYSTTSHNHDLTYAPISHVHTQYMLECNRNLEDMCDVTISLPVDGHVLKYLSGKWVNGTGGGGDGLNSLCTLAPLKDNKSLTDPILSIVQASTSTDGYLTSTDWNTFNNKLGSIPSEYITESELASELDGYLKTVAHNSTTSISGGMTNNHSHFATFATIAAIEAASNPSGVAYVEEKQAYYVYCATCAIARDGDLVLNTPTTGKWQLLQKISRKMGETGWIDRDSALLSKLDSDTVRFAISSTAVYAIKGIKYELTTGNYDLDISGDAGLKYIYFDADKVLKSRLTFWDFEAETPVAIAYWSGSSIVGIQTELHGIRDIVWHKWAHTYLGTQYKDGLLFTGSIQADSVNDPGSSSSFYNLWSTSGTITDEDIEITIASSGQWAQTLGSNLTTDPGVFTFFYHNGTAITGLSAMVDKTPFIYNGVNGTPRWESNGTLTDSITGDYIAYHYFASPLIGGQAVYARPHNSKFASLSSALLARPSQLIWTNYAELKHLYTAIFRVNTGWSTTHRAKLVSLQDFRTVPGTPIAGVSATDHQSLSNRDAINAHPITSIDSGTTPNSVIKVGATGSLMESGVSIDSSNNITANNLSGTNTGDETKLSINQKQGIASTSTDGYLTSTDWNTFNNKLGSIPSCYVDESELTTCLTSYSTTSHNHTGVYQPVGDYATKAWVGDGYAIIGHNHTGTYEPANSNIQTHIGTADIHCPSACFATTAHTHANYISTVGTIDSQTKSANGLVISGNCIYAQNADASNPGLVSTGAQAFCGQKTLCGGLIVKGEMADCCPGFSFLANPTWGFGLRNADGYMGLYSSSGLKLYISGDNTTVSEYKFKFNPTACSITLPTTRGVSGQYLCTDGSGCTSWSTPAGGGDVLGPSSAVANAIALFDGTTGKAIKDSGCTTSCFASATHNHAGVYLESIPSCYVVGPASSVDGYVALFDSTTGKLLKQNADNMPTMNQAIGATNSISTAVDWNKAYNYLTVSGNVTFTFANAADGKTVSLVVIGDGSTRVLTWPAGIKWAVASGVYTNLTASKSNMYTFTQINSVIYATVVVDLA